MKKDSKLIKVIIFGLLGLAFLYSQDNSGKIAEYQRKLLEYSPKFQILYESVTADKKKDYDTFMRMLSDIETEYIRRIIISMDIAYERVSNEQHYNGEEYPFSESVNYFAEVSSQIKNNKILIKALSLLKKAETRFDLLQRSFTVAQQEELKFKEIEYEIHRTQGILLMYRGSPAYYRQALVHFNYLLGEGKEKSLYTLNKEEEILIRNYIAGNYHKLFDFYRGDYTWGFYYARLELYNLWKLIELSDEEQEVKDYKYKYLVDKYDSIIDKDGSHYHLHYKRYSADAMRDISNKDEESQPVKATTAQ